MSIHFEVYKKRVAALMMTNYQRKMSHSRVDNRKRLHSWKTKCFQLFGVKLYNTAPPK